MHGTLLLLLEPAKSFSWKDHLTNADSAQASIKARADTSPPLTLSHTHKNTNTQLRNTCFSHVHWQLLHVIRWIKRNTHTHTYTQSHVHMLLSECCLLTRSSIGKRFSLPHTHRGEGKVCVRALVPPDSVFTNTLFYNTDVCVWVCDSVGGSHRHSGSSDKKLKEKVLQ